MYHANFEQQDGRRKTLIMLVLQAAPLTSAGFPLAGMKCDQGSGDGSLKVSPMQIHLVDRPGASHGPGTENFHAIPVTAARLSGRFACGNVKVKSARSPRCPRTVRGILTSILITRVLVSSFALRPPQLWLYVKPKTSARASG